MEQSPSSEAYSHLASQRIPRLLWNPRLLQMYSKMDESSFLKTNESAFSAASDFVVENGRQLDN
jgi:hypothetical protein